MNVPLVLALVGSAAGSSPPRRMPLLTTAAVERLTLPRAGAPYTILFDVPGSDIALRPKGKLESLGNGAEGILCQPVGEREGTFLFRCKSRRVDAILSKGGTELTLIQLRGLPWRQDDDAPPSIYYPPTSVESASPCPAAEDEASRGECALSSGDASRATALFRKALTGPHADLAALRLGDLALLRDDPEEAAGYYDLAGDKTAMGALAQERLAELIGNDVLLSRLSVAESPPLIQHELTLRLARWKYLDGGLVEAAADLYGPEAGDVCVGQVKYCQHLLLAALREPRSDRARALVLYMGIKRRGDGPLAIDLAEAASEIAAEEGAPRFGANLRAALFPKVPKERQLDYLRRTAELFLQAGDDARAQVICDFARTQSAKLDVCASLLADRQVSGSGVPEVAALLSAERQLELDAAEATKAVTAAKDLEKDLAANPAGSTNVASAAGASQP